jgi:hypothetical protein
MGPASLTVDGLGRIHVLWSEGFPYFAPFQMMRLLYGTIADEWPIDPDTVAEHSPPDYPNEASIAPDYAMTALPDNTLLFYWLQDTRWDFWLRNLSSEGWAPAKQPFPSFTLRGGGMSYKPSLTLGPRDSLHLVFIGSPNRGSREAFGVYHATRHFLDEEWSAPRLIPQSANPLPVECRVAVSTEAVVYAFWVVWKTPGVLGSFDIYYSFSEDGIAWSPPVDLSKMEQILGLSSVHTDRSGNWHAIFSSLSLGSKSQLYYIYGKRDEWVGPLPLYDWQGFEGFVIDPHGRLHLVYANTEGTFPNAKSTRYSCP